MDVLNSIIHTTHILRPKYHFNMYKVNYRKLTNINKKILSGANWYGVPANVFARSIKPVPSSYLDIPKSPIFMLPQDVRKILDVLISLCKTFFECI